MTQEEHFTRSAAVFAGKVVSLEKAVISENGLEVEGYNAKLEVNRIWKGDVDVNIVVFVNHTDQYWDVVFEEERSYLVYAIYTDPFEKHLQAFSCNGRVIPLEYAEEDLAILGGGVLPLPVSSPTSTPTLSPPPTEVDTTPPKPSEEEESPVGGIAVVIAIVLSLIGLFVWKLRRKKSLS